MNRMRQVDAIIFDLRRNHGGDPEAVALMATYLFDRRTHLNGFYNRAANRTRELWTLAPIRENELANKPAYVLTSASTFSGAEAFSYDLKMLKRATIVGETTAGGAHMAGRYSIDNHFMMMVPETRPINPISGTDWEGTSVSPDIRVAASNALDTAERLAERALNER